MKTKLALRRLASDFRFRHVAPSRAVPSAAERDVARLWTATLARCPSAYDGRILSVVAVGGSGLTACTASYRYFAAQRARPDLFEALRIRPLAVTGLVRVGSAFLFGRRSRLVAQERGAIELAPSGGVQPACVASDGSIDVGAQLVRELGEEAGLRARAGDVPRILALVDDADEHVVDIVCGLDLRCTEADLLSAYARAASDEYSQLFLVEPGEMAGTGGWWSGRLGAVTAAVVGSRLWPSVCASAPRTGSDASALLAGCAG